MGLITIPLVIAASFLDLMIGITGLCMGADEMAHQTSGPALCLFFCGAIVPPATGLVAFWLVLGTLIEWARSFPMPPILSIFHPPRVSSA